MILPVSAMLGQDEASAKNDGANMRSKMGNFFISHLKPKGSFLEGHMLAIVGKKKRPRYALKSEDIGGMRVFL